MASNRAIAALLKQFPLIIIINLSSSAKFLPPTFPFKDEKKLAELERSLKESGDRRPAHERKVEESQQILDKAKEDKKELEAAVGSITQKRDEYVRPICSTAS